MNRPDRTHRSTRPILRRLFAIACLVVAVALVVLLLVPRFRSDVPPETTRGERRPVERGRMPVLLITVDTTRADHLAPYGADVETPHLARLADRGVTFERAYATAPITLPTHTSILSGLYPPQHGVRNNGTHHADPELTTLAELLKDEGYRTAAFVSAEVLKARYGLDQGFDVYDDDLSTGRERFPRAVPDRPAEATVDAALAWLESVEEDEPFFLWVHLYDPHAAYSPPPPFRDRYRDRLYAGEIAYMDSQIGRLLSHPLLDSQRTAAVVLGDHGESLGEHGEQTHAVLAYDSTLHVPWILALPRGPRGLRVGEAVDQVDLLPTLLDLLELEERDGLPGRNLLPLLEGTAPLPPRPLYAETYLPYYTYGWAKLRVFRRHPWKYIDSPRPELYDLRRDPRELTDLAEVQPGRHHDLGRDLGEWLEAQGDPEREATLALDREAEERLRSLGYLASAQAPDREGERPNPREMIGLHVGLERGRTLMRDRMHAEAAAQLEGVLRRDPQNLAALTDLAAAYEALDRVEDAVTAVEKGLALDPSNPRLHLTLAGLEARRGDLPRALELVDAALDLDPRFLEVSLRKAQLLAQAGRREEVVELLEGLLREHPEEPPVLVSHAQLVELAAGRLEAARERLERAVELDPFLVAGWRFLGEVEERTGDAEAAVAAWRRGLVHQPDDADLHARLGLLLARRGEPEAPQHLREAVRLAQRPRPELHVALGAWLAEQGRLEEAEAEYARVLELEPEHPGALNNRAIALYRNGRLEEAEETFRRLLERHPRHADAWNNLAALEVDRGRWAAAETAARRALALRDDLPEAWNNLALAAGGAGRPEEARRAWDRAVELRPDYWQARFNRAVLERDTGRPEEAERLLREVLTQVPWYGEAHLELGLLYAGPLARPEPARRHLDSFLRQSPNHPRAPEAREEMALMAGVSGD